jgi:hypothetical protein
MGHNRLMQFACDDSSNYFSVISKRRMEAWAMFWVQNTFRLSSAKFAILPKIYLLTT